MAEELEYEEQVPLLPTRNSEDEETNTKDKDDNIPFVGYSLPVSICFALNYQIGAGILGLPYEFYSAGYILSSLMMIILAFLTYITDIYIVDGILRAESIRTLSRSFICSKYDLVTKSQFIKRKLMENSDVSIQNIQQNYMINRNEYQLSELLGIFGGKWWKLLYDIFFGLSTLIVLWSYNVLFGVSLTRNIGISSLSSPCNMETNATTECRGLYSFWICIFWIWTIIITLIDFHHQKWLQVFATSARILILILMITTSIGLMYSNWYYDGEEYNYSKDYIFGSTVTAWDWSGLPYMIAIASFAFGNQFCIPDVIKPLSMEDRHKKQHILWASVTIACAIIYIFCGVTISIYFGANTQSPCTLAWKGYMGFSYAETQPVGALIISWCIILLPAIDIGSAFPLIATTLANTLEAVIMGTIIYDETVDDDNNNNDNNNKYVVILIKISLCTFVSVLALIEWDFELILAFAGAFGLLTVYIGPCVLEWKSKQFINDVAAGSNQTNHEHQDTSKTSVTKEWMTYKIWLFMITGISLIAFIAVFVQTITQNS